MFNEAFLLGIFMPARIDLTGQTISGVLFVERIGGGKWLCKCHCGNDYAARSNDVKRRKSSCGCKKAAKNHEKFIDLTGQVIKGVTFLEHKGGDRSRWLCRCHCGREWVVAAGYIKDKRQPRVSCGCQKKKGKADGHRAATATYHKYRSWAKRAGREFTLTRDEFVQIIFSDCHYCGCPPAQVRNVKGKGKSSVITMNGVDRKNNDVGYTPENCVSACKMCNFMKRAHSYEDFLAHVFKIARIHI
jgi:hypothetical protein